ncbi:MAG TPA: carbohydrate porin [Methyloceanibacter sp.]|jgi:porin|nr:carbohydrate porin [Methyloceanibacter sp.]
MTRWRITASDLAGAIAAIAVAAAVYSFPTAAKANCDVPETPNGIPEEVAFKADVGGIRKGLANYGVGVGGAYYAEPFYNWGGFDEGGEYQGVLELYLNADMHKLGLWRGLCFHTNGYQIHGNSITAANIGSLMPVTSLEAVDATRLFELWLEQTIIKDKLSVRIGQLAADEEFILSDGGGYFINGTWGWPSISAADLPNGGPAYPLATPGVRVAVNPNEKMALLIGVYNGDPAPECNKAGGDPQRCNDHGLDFELDDDPLLMVEGVYRYNQEGRLPGAVKIGGWNHFGTFEDQRFDSGGALIAVTGNPGRPHDNDWGLYGIIDQLIWRVPGSEDPQGVGIFARVIGAPEDRNLIDWYFDAGLTFTGMFRNRPNDAFAVGFAYTNISDQVSAFDVDFGEPVARNYEALIEICYTFQINDGLAIQPDFQYIFQPGGNVAGQKDATVVGARTSISF